MKRWAALTVLLYLLCLSALVVPLFYFLADGDEDVFAMFYVWIVPVLLVAQVALLAVPVAIADERPVARRTVRSAAILGALPMAILLVFFVWCAQLMFLGEDFGDDWLGWVLLAILVGGWIFWSVVFLRGPKSITRWLLGGSILEVLVAIPSHIVARQREDCCAPGITLFGIATGLSVALLAFGPAVLLLIARRVQAKRTGAS